MEMTMNEERLKRLTELCFSNLEKKSVKRGPTCSPPVVQLQPEEHCREGNVRFFSDGYRKRMRDKWMWSHNFQRGKIQSNRKKKVFTMKVAKHWNRVPESLWVFHAWGFSQLSGKGLERPGLTWKLVLTCAGGHTT